MNRRLAQSIFDAYRSGLLRPPDIAHRVFKTDFNRLLRHSLLNHLKLRDRLEFRKIFDASLRGLVLAREDRLTDAAETFQEGRHRLACATCSEPARNFSISMLAAAEAYLLFRLRAFDKALELVHESMDADLKLEDELGLHYLQLHRVQSIHNVVRIDWRRGRSHDAFALAGEILAYLEAAESLQLSVHRDWSSRKLRTAPIRLRRSMLIQVVNEVALQLVECQGLDSWTPFYESTRATSRDSMSLHPRVGQWLHLRNEFCRGNLDEYFRLLPDFLYAGPQDISALWFLSLADIVCLCRINNSSTARFLGDAILKESPKWRRIPVKIMQFLSSAR